jgi:hypothetical protein
MEPVPTVMSGPACAPAAQVPIEQFPMDPIPMGLFVIDLVLMEQSPGSAAGCASPNWGGPSADRLDTGPGQAGHAAAWI